MATLRFQQLPLSSFDTAYNLITASATWLHHRSLPSWLIPQAVYYERHVAGENYGLFAAEWVDGWVAAGALSALAVQPPYCWLRWLLASLNVAVVWASHHNEWCISRISRVIT